MTSDREYRRRALAKIHIASKELGLTDSEYRDLIAATVPGKESAADLDDHELHLLLDRFQELGWRPRIRRHPSRPLPPMVWKARRLWLELYEAGAVKNSQWTALARFVKRMTGVDDLRRVNVHQGTVVIEALKNWLERTSRNA
jgi:phage gp16-like protein